MIKNKVSLYEFKNNKNSFLIADIDEENKNLKIKSIPRFLFKYTSLSAALEILRNQSLLFSIPTAFPDQREGALYKKAMNYLDKTKEGIDDFYTCCFTMAKISEDFTQIYSANSLYKAIFDRLKDNQNIQDLDVIANSIGVCFKFNRKNLKNSLLKNLNENNQYGDYKIIEGKMRYYSHKAIDGSINTPYEKINLQEHVDIEQENTSLFSNEFCQTIVLKNNNFLHENEYRLFIGLKDQSKEDKLTFKIDLNDCLEEIYIYSNLACLEYDEENTNIKLEEARSEIQKICIQNNIKIGKINIENLKLYNIE